MLFLCINLLNDRQKCLSLQARRDADLIQLICAELQEQLAINVVLLERGPFAVVDGWVDKVLHINAAWSMSLHGYIPGWWMWLWFSRELIQGAIVFCDSLIRVLRYGEKSP